MDKESWCTVEMTASQDWTRAERKHNKHAFDSKVFKSDLAGNKSERLTEFKPVDNTTHKERRHFTDKCKNDKKFLPIFLLNNGF